MSHSRFSHIVAALAVSAISSAAFAQHEGHQQKKDPPASQHQAHDKKMADHPAEHAQSQRPSDPYPLGTCPISGEPLGAMGEPLVKFYDGREVRFCCKMCTPKFEAAQADNFKKIDQQIIAQQLPYYPLTTCAVSKEPLVEDGEDIAINYVYQNRLIRFCCKGCIKDFKKDPEATLKKLDAAIIAQQSKNYPLKTCVVSGEELGTSMGDPFDIVIGNRLVRLCCKRCEKKVRATPLAYLPALDAAWKAQGFPSPTNVIPEAANKDHDRNKMKGHDMGKANKDHGDHKQGHDMGKADKDHNDHGDHDDD